MTKLDQLLELEVELRKCPIIGESCQPCNAIKVKRDSLKSEIEQELEEKNSLEIQLNHSRQNNQEIILNNEKLEQQNKQLQEEYKIMNKGNIQLLNENKNLKQKLEKIEEWCNKPENPTPVFIKQILDDKGEKN